MTILTLSGKAESGKDKTAKMIAEELELMGYQVLICHFADLLKYICKQYFGWDGKKNEEGRSLLQIVGTDTIRKQDEGFWVDFIKSILRFFPDEWDFVIISDCRFPNEILSFKEDDEFKTVSVRIVRPNYENHLTEEQRKHPSENALNDFRFDFEIINPGTCEGLENEVKGFISHLFSEDNKKTLIDKIKEKL